MARSLASTGVAVVVLAAGAGTRMKSAKPKVLHPLAGWPMLRHVLANVGKLKPARVIGVVAPGADDVVEAFGACQTVVQKVAMGTGDAARTAMPLLKNHTGPILVVFGDAPLVQPETMNHLVETCLLERAAVGVLGFRAADPTPYGRLVVRNGALEKIVESKDARGEERAIDLCNSGVMCLDGALAAKLLNRIGNDNVKREFYLVDAVALARQSGHHTVAVEGPESEFQGINSRAELAAAERVLQQRLRAAAMAAGVTMTDPDTVWLATDTRFGQDVTIGPCVRFGAGVTVGANADIRAFCDIEGAKIGRDAIIGPFARIRPASVVGDDVHIGNFVELKATVMGKGAKANHLAYLGDATVGAASNIGAGTIAVNYDGYGKWRTEIGADSFVGSNSSLVAPVKIGRGANVTAGSVITADVPANAVAFGRARQETKKGRAPALRAKLKTRALKHKRGKK